MHFSDSNRLHAAAARILNTASGELTSDGYLVFSRPDSSENSHSSSSKTPVEPFAPAASKDSTPKTSEAAQKAQKKPAVHPAFGGPPAQPQTTQPLQVESKNQPTSAIKKPLTAALEALSKSQQLSQLSSVIAPKGIHPAFGGSAKNSSILEAAKISNKISNDAPTQTPDKPSLNSPLNAKTVHPAFGGPAFNAQASVISPLEPPEPTLSSEPKAVHAVFGRSSHIQQAISSFEAKDENAISSKPLTTSAMLNNAEHESQEHLLTPPPLLQPPKKNDIANTINPDSIAPLTAVPLMSRVAEPNPQNFTDQSWAALLETTQERIHGGAAFAISPQGLVVECIGNISDEKGEILGAYLLAALDLTARLGDADEEILCTHFQSGFVTLVRLYGRKQVALGVLSQEPLNQKQIQFIFSQLKSRPILE